MDNEKIEQILEIRIRVKTNKSEDRTICLTDFCNPQNVELTRSNDEVILRINRGKCEHDWVYTGCDEYRCSKCGERKYR